MNTVSNADPTKMIRLVTKGDQSMLVEKEIAKKCGYLEYRSQDINIHSFDTVLEVQLPEIEKEELKKVMEFCRYEHHAEQAGTSDEEINEWKTKYGEMNGALAIKVLHAAEYVYYMPLANFMNEILEKETKGKTDEELYRYVSRGFNFECDSDDSEDGQFIAGGV